jgi:uncharacterized protein
VDHRLISYLYFFNVKQDYYECHEYGESLWLDSGRPIVLKGLIQAAVCLYHLHNGNVKGGWRMWQRARQYVADELPIYEGMDLNQLTQDIDEVFSRVPSDWHDKIVPAAAIAELKLPTVRIKIVDPHIEQILSNWTPEPLEHDR